MYKRSKCAIKINNKLNKFFDHEKGVRQGDPLSPTLFNIFINDLFKEINTSHADFVSLNNIDRISALMFADDLILISTTREGRIAKIFRYFRYICKKMETRNKL